jgi:hypothetical protein
MASMSDVVNVEKLDSERLWVISVYENSHAAVDMWEAAVRAYIDRMNGAPERYLVYDLSQAARISLTNYTRQRTTVLAKDNPEATGRVAVVVRGAPALLHIFDLFVRYTSRQLQPRLDVKLFNERGKAIEWVKAILPPEEKAILDENSRSPAAR